VSDIGKRRQESPPPFTLEIDKQIVEGFLVDQEATLRSLASAGLSRREVLDRASLLGLSNDVIKSHRLSGAVVSVRKCLSCDDVFLSVGPQNRLCNRCRKRG
jgi:hypothetical protein